MKAARTEASKQRMSLEEEAQKLREAMRDLEDKLTKSEFENRQKEVTRNLNCFSLSSPRIVSFFLKETTPTSRIAKTSRNRGLKRYHVRITSSRFNWSKHAATMRTGYELRAGRNLVVSGFSRSKLIKFIDQFEAEIGSLTELLEREKKKSETLEKQLGELHDQHETQQYFATLYKVALQLTRVV